MPIVKRGISQPWAYSDAHLYLNAPANTVLQNVTMAGMSGSLAQLGYLAAYASEMFDNLFKFANSLNERISDINGRTARLMTQIPSVESTITGSSFKLEMGTAKLDRGEDQPQTQLFLPDSKPTAIRARYESPEVFRTPALKEVNAVLLPATLAEHGPCEAKFSNPDFFVNEWRKEEEARLNKLAEEKAARKLEKRQRRQREKERKEKEAETAQAKREKKKDLNWRKKYATDDSVNPLSRAESKRSNMESLVERQAPFQPTSISAPVSPRTPSNFSNTLSVDIDPIVEYDDPGSPRQLPASLMHPNPPPLRLSSSSEVDGPPTTMAPRSLPPAIPRTSLPPPPPFLPSPQGESSGETMYTPSAMPTIPSPPPMPPSSPLPPPLPTQAVPMPPALPGLPRPPALPAANNSLMASIQTGKKLRTAEAEQAPRVVNPQANLLSAIREGGLQLKKVQSSKEPPKRVESTKALGAFGGSAISDILQRRKYLQDEDSEESDDDEDQWN